MKLHLFRYLFSLLWAAILIGGCSETSTKFHQPEFVIGIWSGREEALIKEVVNEYSTKSRIQVRVEAINADAYHNRLWSYILSKSPNWDIAIARSEWIPQWIDYQGLQPITTPEISSEARLSELIFDGELYAWPISGEIPMLWYRADILSEANIAPPKTWDELYDAAKALTDPPTLYGFAFANDPLNIGGDFLNMLIGYRGPLHLDQKLIDFNTTEGISSLQFLTRLNQERLIPPVDESVDPFKAMQEGRAVMAILWSSQAEDLFDCQKSPAVCQSGETLIVGTTIPSANHGIASSYLRRSTAFIIPSGSDCTDEAEAFIAWLSTQEGKSAWARAGEGDQQGSNRSINPARDLATQYFPAGISLDRFNFSDGFNDQLNEAVYQSVNGESDPADTLRNLASSYQDDLNRTDSRP